MTETDRSRLSGARLVVVKIGSTLLVDDHSGRMRRAWLDALADDLAALHQSGVEIIVVSSGAIAVGRHHLDLKRKAIRLEEQQAAAATGQIRLAHAYQETLARHHITVAQILLTLSDTEERRRHLNARSTLATLLRLGTIPVINENDTVATAEIRFGDNDRLAARVAAMMNADALVLLSDIDGLYAADPRKHPDAEFVPIVRALTPEIEAMAGKAPPGYSSGGMVTKMAAARIALAAGCRMAIADGRRLHPIAAIPLGRVTVDDGALRALEQGKSLLPAGVTGVAGQFERGDAVIVEDSHGREVARGLVAYSIEDSRRILGYKSREIEARLGYRGREELIHRDDLVLT
jgi:glutamate 5-kinase